MHAEKKKLAFVTFLENKDLNCTAVQYFTNCMEDVVIDNCLPNAQPTTQLTYTPEMTDQGQTSKLYSTFVSNKSDNIRRVFLKYLNSTKYLKNIYSSYRMIFFSKTIALKYVEQTRSAAIHP